MLKQQIFSATQAPIAPPIAGPQSGDTPDMTLAKSLHILAGGSGVALVTDTSPQAYNTLGVIVIADAVFSALTGVAGFSVAGLTGQSIPAGLTLPLRLSAFTLTSGKVLSVKA